MSGGHFDTSVQASRRLRRSSLLLANYPRPHRPTSALMRVPSLEIKASPPALTDSHCACALFPRITYLREASERQLARPAGSNMRIFSSDTANLYVSALDKVAEFRRLRYPLGLLRKACAYIAATSGVRQWLNVRQALR